MKKHIALAVISVLSLSFTDAAFAADPVLSGLLIPIQQSEQTALQSLGLGINNSNTIQSMQSQITANQIQTNRGIAASVAAQTPLPLLKPGESALAFGNGTYAGQSALAVSFAHGVNISGHDAI